MYHVWSLQTLSWRNGGRQTQWRQTKETWHDNIYEWSKLDLNELNVAPKIENFGKTCWCTIYRRRRKWMIYFTNLRLAFEKRFRISRIKVSQNVKLEKLPFCIKTRTWIKKSLFWLFHRLIDLYLDSLNFSHGTFEMVASSIIEKKNCMWQTDTQTER